jgi:predicted HTH domain antitoxin
MMNTELFKGIASEIQIFQNIEQKENFLFVLGALSAKVISLKKAAEVMEVEPEAFLKLLELIGFEFSYLSQEDVSIEKSW